MHCNMFTLVESCTSCFFTRDAGYTLIIVEEVHTVHYTIFFVFNPIVATDIFCDFKIYKDDLNLTGLLYFVGGIFESYFY